jgi:hypothetical protein
MSSIMDLAAALGGGAGPGAGPGGPPPGPPPDLGGGYGPPGQGPPDQGQGQSPADALDAAETALQAYMQLEPDHSDRAIAAQCLQQIAKLKAKDQSDMQSLQNALSMNPAAAGPQGPPPPGGALG